MMTRTFRKERLTIRMRTIYLKNVRLRKLPPVSVEARTLDLCGGGATEVVPPAGTITSLEMSN